MAHYALVVIALRGEPEQVRAGTDVIRNVVQGMGLGPAPCGWVPDFDTVADGARSAEQLDSGDTFEVVDLNP